MCWMAETLETMWLVWNLPLKEGEKLPSICWTRWIVATNLVLMVPFKRIRRLFRRSIWPNDWGNPLTCRRVPYGSRVGWGEVSYKSKNAKIHHDKIGSRFSRATFLLLFSSANTYILRFLHRRICLFFAQLITTQNFVLPRTSHHGAIQRSASIRYYFSSYQVSVRHYWNSSFFLRGADFQPSDVISCFVKLNSK
jgi:hypothetical protein